MLHFTDDSDTEVIARYDTGDQPVNLATNLNGLFRGWAGARLEVVTTNNTIATVTVGYIKVNTGLTFTEWDALR